MTRSSAGTVLLLTLLMTLSASLATAQVKVGRVRVSESFSESLVMNKVQPIYPPLARQARIQGMVVLRVHISKAGDVEDMQLVSGHPMLAPSAINAVKQWKYKPYLLNGEPVEIETQVTVNFTLADKPAPENVAADAPDAAPSQAPEGPPRTGVPLRIRVSQGVGEKLLKTKVNPDYPPDAKAARIQGTVMLKTNIDQEGNVYRVDLISGHPLLAPAAIEAVKQWKYQPYLLNGQPIEVETTVQVNFTLVE